MFSVLPLPAPSLYGFSSLLEKLWCYTRLYVYSNIGSLCVCVSFFFISLLPTILFYCILYLPFVRSLYVTLITFVYVHFRESLPKHLSALKQKQFQPHFVKMNTTLSLLLLFLFFLLSGKSLTIFCSIHFSGPSLMSMSMNVCALMKKRTNANGNVD